MRRLFLSGLVTVFCLLIVCATWRLLPRESRGIVEQQHLEEHQDQSRAAIVEPDVDAATPKPAPDFLSQYFIEYSRASTIASLAPHGPNVLLEIVELPLRSYDEALAAGGTSKLPARDHLLLFIERIQSERLLDARVLGFMRTHSELGHSTRFTIVQALGTEQAYVVLTNKAADGLKIRVCLIDRQLATSEVLERLTSQPSTAWPNMLRTISDLPVPVPFPAKGSPSLTVKAVEREDGHHLDFEIRDGSKPMCQLEPLTERSYSIDSDQWSSVIPRPPKPPWKLEPESMEVIAVLPFSRQQRNADRQLVNRPRCLAVVRQGYQSLPSERGWRTRGAFWVVECTPDCDLTDAVGVGLIHPAPNADKQDFACFAAGEARLVFQPELSQYFLVLAGYLRNVPTARLYSLNLDNPMTDKPFALASDPRDWPPQLPLLTEQRMSLGGGGGSWSNDIYESCGFPMRHGGDAGIVVGTNRSFSLGEVRYEYSFKQRIWTKATLHESESAIPAHGKKLPRDAGLAATTDTSTTCELVPESTKVIAVSPMFRHEANDKSRCLVAVEQKYRFDSNSPVTPDAVGTTVWFLDCPSDCSLKNAIPLGLIHPGPLTSRFDQILMIRQRQFNAEWFVALAGAENSQLKIRLFRSTFDKALNCQPLILGSDPKNWPPQMTLATVLRTDVPLIGRVDALSTASVIEGDTISIQAIGTNFDEVRYRYRRTSDQWTRIDVQRSE